MIASPHEPGLFCAVTPEVARALALQADRTVALRTLPTVRHPRWYTHDVPPPDPRPPGEYWKIHVWDMDPEYVVQRPRFNEGKLRSVLFATFFQRFTHREPSTTFTGAVGGRALRWGDPPSDPVEDLKSGLDMIHPRPLGNGYTFRRRVPDIIEEVLTEQMNQVIKGRTPAVNDARSYGDWILCLANIVTKYGIAHQRRMWIKIAAMAISAAQSFDRTGKREVSDDHG